MGVNLLGRSSHGTHGTDVDAARKPNASAASAEAKPITGLGPQDGRSYVHAARRGPLDGDRHVLQAAGIDSYWFCRTAGCTR
jgi:hypothetical protein